MLELEKREHATYCGGCQVQEHAARRQSHGHGHAHLVESYKAHTHGSWRRRRLPEFANSKIWLNNTWLQKIVPESCFQSSRVVTVELFPERDVSRELCTQHLRQRPLSLVIFQRLSVILAQEDVCSHHVLASHGVLLAATHRL